MINGAWNQAILTSGEWLKANISAFADAEPLANIEVQVPALNFRVIMGQTVLLARRESVVIASQLVGDAAIERIRSVARDILSNLPHTPITAVGHNFNFKLVGAESFRRDQLGLSASLRKKMGSLFGDWETKSSTLSHKLDVGGAPYALGVQIERHDSGHQVVGFNFHYVIANSDIEKALEAIDNFPQNHPKARALADSLVRQNDNV